METTSTVSHAVNNYYDREMLERALPNLVHTRYGQVRDIPRNGTNIIKFRKYGALAAATTPLSEGVTPSGASLSITDVTATVRQYGDFVTLSDFLQLTTLDPLLLETAQVLGEQAGLTLDTIARDVIVAGTAVQYCDATSPKANDSRDDVAAADVISTAGELDLAIRTMKGNNVKKITRMVRGDLAYNTSPVNACYVGIVHPNTVYNLSGITGWISVEKYASKADVMEGEIGAYKEIRFVESSQAKVFTSAGAGSIDVYATLILGANAYGVSRISGAAMQNIVKPLGSSGTADPLNQRATSGWKATFAAVILQQLFMLRLEHAIT